MKQALVRQGMHREQENSHLGWPDHTGVLTKRTSVSFEPLDDSQCDFHSFIFISGRSYFLDGIECCRD